MAVNYINAINDTSSTPVPYYLNESVDTRIFRATCSTAASTAAKVATLEDATNYSLAAGVRVAVTFTYGNSAGTPTLNVNSGGAKTIVTPTSETALTSGNGTSYNTWGAYETVIFTYNGTYWVKGGTGYAGYNAYNRGSIAHYRNSEYYGASYKSLAACYRYILLFSSIDGLNLVPVNSVNNSTATTKTLTTNEFNPFGDIFYYATTTTVSSGGTFGNFTLYRQYELVDLRYSFNTGTTLTAKKAVYMVCAPQTSGMVKLHTSPISQTLPNTYDGLLYIYLGQSYDTYRISLVPDHPIYWYMDGQVSLYTAGNVTNAEIDDMFDLPGGGSGSYSESFESVKVNNTLISAEDGENTLELTGGDNIILTPDNTNKKVTIASPNSMVETIKINSVFGQVTKTSGKMFQGMTTDGTYLYLAAISTSDMVSNPEIRRFNISTQQEDGNPKYPSKKGHYNNLNYRTPYIYATGFNTQDVNDDYSQIYRYKYSDNTGTAITTPSWYWNFAVGDTQYNTSYYIGLVASRNAYDIYTSRPSGTPAYTAFTRSPIEFGNGTEQGCCIWERPNTVDSSVKYKYILTILTDPRSFNSPTHGGQEILITSLTGRTVKRLVLDLPYFEELEDICVVGNTVYFNSANGRIYKINDISIYANAYWEEYKPFMWQKPCYLYINENGTETSDTGTYGSSSGTLLREFYLSPLVEENLLKSSARGMFVFRSQSHIPITVNPNTGNLTIEFSCIDGIYTYDFRLFYQVTSTSNCYKYTLASVKGGYRNNSGTLTTYDVTSISMTPGSSYVNLLNNVFYSGSSYISYLVADPTIDYNSSPVVVG